MWVFTRRGFYSAVEDTTNRGRVLVRGRALADMESLIDLAQKAGLRLAAILETPDRDYRYRIPMKKSEWIVLLARLGAEIDYPNFKNAIHDDDPERAKRYTEVWAAMLGLEKK